MAERYGSWRKERWKRFYTIGYFLLYLGGFANVLCCSLLVGMYFQYHYSDSPGMFWGYVLVSVTGFCIGVSFWFYSYGRAKNRHKECKPGGLLAPLINTHREDRS